MKKILMITLTLCLLFAGTSYGQSLKGQMAAGGYLGYSIGMGDAFDDVEVAGGSFSSDAGFSFGGHFHYGISEKLMLGGEIFFQSYSYDYEYDAGFLGSASGSDSENNVNFMATCLYNLNMDEKKAFFLTGGIGFYDTGNTDIGLNGGVLYRTMVSETIGLYVMPRIHIVMANDMFELIQISAGVQIPFGPAQ